MPKRCHLIASDRVELVFQTIDNTDQLDNKACNCHARAVRAMNALSEAPVAKSSNPLKDHLKW